MYLLGTDVHGGYGPIDFAKVREAGLEFVIAKHTEGNDPGHDDGSFWRNVEQARAHGLIVGRYHFGYSLPPRTPGDGRSPVDEARRSWAAAKGFGTRPGELPPFVDAEWPAVTDWARWGCSPKQVSEWWRVHCEETAQLWGRMPIIYTYPAWWEHLERHADTSWASVYKLWMASDGALQEWRPRDGSKPRIPETWGDDWLFWQFGFNGSRVAIPGINANPVDRDCFNGDRAALLRLALIDPESPTEPEPFAIVHPKVPLGRDGLDS